MSEQKLCFDSNDSNDVVSTNKMNGMKPRHKVQEHWTDDEVMVLIASVEKHPGLWIKNILDYNGREKKKSREEDWLEVQRNLSNKFSITEIKGKWINLRSNYKNNMARYKKQCEKGKGDKGIAWRFQGPMSFLDMNKTGNSTQSISSIDLTFDEDSCEEFLLEESAGEQTISLPSVQSHPEYKEFGQTPAPSQVPTPSPPLSSSSSLVKPDLNSSAIEALISMSERKKDKYSAFGEYIAAELRSIGGSQADYVQRKLNRAFIELIEEVVKN